jgi:hypothetical protein
MDLDEVLKYLSWAIFFALVLWGLTVMLKKMGVLG